MGKMRLLILVGVCITFFVASGTGVFAQADVDKHKACIHCGMDREKFAQSRMLITYEDGSEAAVCSLHCAAVDLSLNLDKMPKSIQVGDYNTKKLIDAEQATWVVGGNKPGVMSKRGKWAFEKNADADAFTKGNGGMVVPFDDAIKAAYEDMYGDTKMIRDKRKMMKKMNHKM